VLKVVGEGKEIPGRGNLGGGVLRVISKKKSLHWGGGEKSVYRRSWTEKEKSFGSGEGGAFPIRL